MQHLRHLVSNVTFKDAGDWQLGASVAANTGTGAVGVVMKPAY